MFQSRSWMARCSLPVVLALLVCASPAQSQDYPSRPIRLIVPTAVGGGFDILARYMAQRMGDDHKISVVVENRVGAGTVAGTEFAAKAPADGYTLMLGGVSNSTGLCRRGQRRLATRREPGQHPRRQPVGSLCARPEPSGRRRAPVARRIDQPGRRRADLPDHRRVGDQAVECRHPRSLTCPTCQ